MTMSAGVQAALDDLSEMIAERGGTINIRVYVPKPEERIQISADAARLINSVQSFHFKEEGPHAGSTVVDGDSDKESGLKRDAADQDCVAAQRDRITAEELARYFHNQYESLAPHFGYSTRQESAVHWDYVPEDNKALMIAVAAGVIAKFGLNR